MADDALRAQIARLLDWEDAHVAFDSAVKDIPESVRGRRPDGVPHSPWDLVEHIRIAQRDILEFCTDPAYKEMKWPGDYWPAPSSRPTLKEWEQSLQEIRADREALQRLAAEADLYARIPHGSGQTYLRELLLIADHTAYHIGQLVLVRRLLGAWPA